MLLPKVSDNTNENILVQTEANCCPMGNALESGAVRLHLGCTRLACTRFSICGKVEKHRKNGKFSFYQFCIIAPVIRMLVVAIGSFFRLGF